MFLKFALENWLENCIVKGISKSALSLDSAKARRAVGTPTIEQIRDRR